MRPEQGAGKELRYLVFREPDSHLWRWRLYRENGRKLAESVEKFYNKADCLESIDLVRGSSAVPIDDDHSPSSS